MAANLGSLPGVTVVSYSYKPINHCGLLVLKAQSSNGCPDQLSAGSLGNYFAEVFSEVLLFTLVKISHSEFKGNQLIHCSDCSPFKKGHLSKDWCILTRTYIMCLFWLFYGSMKLIGMFWHVFLLHNGIYWKKIQNHMIPLCILHILYSPSIRLHCKRSKICPSVDECWNGRVALLRCCTQCTDGRLAFVASCCTVMERLCLG